jgi:hypothetical protein
MKTLYDYINESILNKSEETINNGDIYVAVEEWLTTHYNIKGTYNINVSKGDCVVDVNGDIRMGITKGGYDTLTNGMFRFGTVNGHFDANYQNFKDLKGSPRVVTGKFSINNNNSPFTCEGGPDKVYSISLGTNCVSLEGMPQEVESFVWASGAKLTTLKGCGKAVGYDFSESEFLESLEGIPAVKCTINLNGCKKLKNLKGLENTILQALRLESCKGLKSLDGIPAKFADAYINGVNPLLDLRDTNLKTLKGIPSNADWRNVDVDICGCDNLEDISMLPKCAALHAYYLPKLSKDCYDNIKTYADKVETDDEFPMIKAKKSRLRGSVYFR